MASLFDYVKIDGLTVAVRNVKGLGAPAPRRDVVPRTSRHGARDLTKYYEGRVIDLEGVLALATPNATWVAFDALKAKLHLGAARTLTFQRPGFSEVEELVEVRVASPVDDVESHEEPGVLRWAVSLFAPDPRIYGAIVRSGTYDPAGATAGGGVAFPMNFAGGGVNFSTTTATHLELANEGNMSTPPTLTIKGPVVNPSLDNDTTGESIRLKYTLGSNDTIVVDVATRGVLLNGAPRKDLIDVATTTWWELASGANKIRARGTGMSLGTTSFTCQYRNARI